MTEAMSTSDENDFPVEFKRLVLLWQDIKTGFFGGKESRDTERYESGLRTAAWAWDPKLQKVPPSEVNRRGEVLLGPLFCSIENPWPQEDGQPMIPLLQIDLANASRLSGAMLGNGLLQMFCPVKDKLGHDIYKRVIERESVPSEALTDPPSFSDDVKGFASVGWAQTNSNDRRLYGRDCLQITGYAEKRFTLWMPSPLTDEYEVDHLDADLIAKIQEFDEIIASKSDEWSPGGFHLFGTFYPIQYYPAEKDKVLFTLESEHGFNFGDGQAQIFYKLYEWGAGFSFDWACY